MHRIALRFVAPRLLARLGRACPARRLLQTAPLPMGQEKLSNLDASTVRAVAEQPGMHGGRRFVYEKKPGRVWFCNAMRPVEQGDPRTAMQALGPAAPFYGYAQLSENRITVPDTKELNGALAAAKKLVCPRVYNCASEAPDPLYLEGLGQGYVPVAMNSGNYFLHDIASYHFWGFAFLPPPLWAHVQRRSRAYAQFMRQHSFSDRLGHYLVGDLDQASAAVLVRLTDPKAVERENLLQWLSLALGKGESALSGLQHWFAGNDSMVAEYRAQRPHDADLHTPCPEATPAALNRTFDDDLMARLAAIQAAALDAPKQPRP